MMIRALVVAASLLVALPVHAQPAEINPALFVARDADSTIYLYGTVHVRPTGAAWSDADVRTAIAASDEVWTELDISPQADAETERLVRDLGAAPSGQGFTSVLTADEAARVRAVAQRLGIPVANFERARPWLAALTLTIVPILQAGFDPNSGVDRAVDTEADRLGKKRRAFETPEQQIRFLADLSPELQREMLLDAIEDTEEGPAMLTAMSQSWERGDLSDLERLVITELKAEYPELYDALFRARNAQWTERLMQELDGAGVDFVAVGAGHLVGEDSVIAMLRARGVRVERVGER